MKKNDSRLQSWHMNEFLLTGHWAIDRAHDRLGCVLNLHQAHVGGAIQSSYSGGHWVNWLSKVVGKGFQVLGALFKGECNCA